MLRRLQCLHQGVNRVIIKAAHLIAPILADGRARLSSVQLITDALERVKSTHGTKAFTPQTALAEVGGFEIAQIIGAMLASAQAGKSILVDGFIVSVAALFATRIAPKAQDYMLFAHCSAEHAHQQSLFCLVLGHCSLC